MGQDWFDSIAVKPESNKVDPWFDQFSTPTAKTVEEQPKSLSQKLLKGSPFDPDDKSSLTDKAKTVGKRLLFGDKKSVEGRDIVGPPRDDDSLLPTNITGSHEPESYAGGFANSLYKDYIRPLGSPSAALSILGTKPANGAVLESTRLRAADRGLPIDPRAIPLRDGPMHGPFNTPMKALPPAPPEIANAPVSYVQGPGGTARTNQTYPMDIGSSVAQPGSLTQPTGRALDDAGKIIPSPGGTILPRELEGITNLPGPDAARLGTRFGNISKIETSSPKANIVSLDKVRGGSPIQLPKLGNEDIPMPNERSLADSFAPTELPSPDARPFGSTRKPGTNEWDTVREVKSGEQALDATGANSGNTMSRGEPKSIDIAKNSSNKLASEAIPPPGQARAAEPPVPAHSNSKDVNWIRQEVGSVDKTLESRPETQGVVRPIIEAQDKKTQWIATTQKQLADITKGLGKADRIQLGELLERVPGPQDNPDLVRRATAARAILDQAHAMVPGLKGNPQIGYLENYLTHIAKDPEATGARGVWEQYFKKPFNELVNTSELSGTKGTGTKDFYETGLGNPQSPYAKERTGALKNIERDPNKIFPAYTESIAKQIFDKPAVDMAKKVIAGLPDTDIYGQPSKLKDLAQWYVKNYTHYDAQAALGNIWNKYTSAIMRTTARSMLGFSTGLQTLHLARIPMNLYPELGERYLMHGAGQVMKNPAAAYKEAASLGLLQNEVKPFAFKTIGEKTDSLIGFFQAADFLDKAIGYHGFKQRFIDEGMNAADASVKALAASKKASLTIDPARSIRSFNPEPGLVGSVARLSAQFKQVPVKIIEQYVQIASAAKRDPKTAVRAMIGLGIAVTAAEAGFHTLHVSPRQFAVDTGGASFSAMRQIYRSVLKGDVTKALEDTALFLTPAGRSIQRQIKSGLSMFEKDNNRDLPMPK